MGCHFGYHRNVFYNIILFRSSNMYTACTVPDQSIRLNRRGGGTARRRVPGRRPVAPGGKTAGLSEMVRSHGWNPARTVMVGDRPDGDVRAGNRVGCRTVLVRREGGEYAAVAPSSPDDVAWRTIAHLRELPALLSSL